MPTPQPPANLRLVMLGMPCAESEPPLAALLAAGFDVRALLLSDGPPGSPVERRARSAGVAILPGGRLDAAALDAIAALRPDAVVVACFPRKLPSALLRLPPLGCLNVHPSLLPLGRGPEPVFWTLRRGERRTGATIHRMEERFDAGPILAQAEIDVPDGVRAPDLERELMALGGRLLVEALPPLAAGAIEPRPQDDALATDAPLPSPPDWLMPTNLPAGWAFNFARGVAPLGGPLAVQGAALGVLPVRDAVAFDPRERLDAHAVERGRGVLRVRFSPGWVEFLT